MRIKTMLLGILLIVSIMFLGVSNASETSTDVSEANTDEVLQLDLQQAIDYGLEHNISIKIADLSIEKNKISYREARRASVDGNASGSLNGVLTDRGYYKRQSEMVLKVAEKTKEATKESIKIGIENSYFTILNKQEDIKTKEIALDRAQKLLDIAKSRLDLGVGTKQEVLSAEANLETAKLNLANAKDDLKYEKMNFNKLLGLELNKEVELTDQISFEKYPEVSLEEKIAEALENRLDVISAKEQYEVDKLNFEITSAVAPSNTYDYKESEFDNKKSYQELIDTENDVRLALNQSYIDLQKAQRAVEATKKNVESLEEAYRLTSLSYESGLKTITDVMEMQVNLNDTELAYNQALLQYELAKINFEASYGIGL